MNRRTEAAERFAERRRREDAAPRLRDIAPDLLSCKVEVTDGRADAVTTDVLHTRHLVVERGPAILVIGCSDAGCRDGGHDLSTMLVRGLRERHTEIRGEDLCDGNVGAAHCGRRLRFRATATYKQATP